MDATGGENLLNSLFCISRGNTFELFPRNRFHHRKQCCSNFKGSIPFFSCMSHIHGTYKLLLVVHALLTRGNEN